jgi:serine/threonine protein kinase
VLPCILRRRSSAAPAAPACTRGRGLDIAIKLAKGVAALHRAGIVHRDIKPENVILQPDGGLKLIDLGVARLPQLEGHGAREFPRHAELHGTGAVRRRAGRRGQRPVRARRDHLPGVLGRRVSLRRDRGILAAAFRPARAAQQAPAGIHRRGWTTCWPAPLPSTASHASPTPSNSAFELENGSVRAIPRSVMRQRLYERNPTRFWQIVSALLLIALLVVAGAD